MLTFASVPEPFQVMCTSMGVKFSCSMILYLRQAKHELDLRYFKLLMNLRSNVTILLPEVEYLRLLFFFLFFYGFSLRLSVKIGHCLLHIFIGRSLLESWFVLLSCLSLGCLTRLFLHSERRSRSWFSVCLRQWRSWPAGLRRRLLSSLLRFTDTHLL